MKKPDFFSVYKKFVCVFGLLSYVSVFGQMQNNLPEHRSDFWQRVQIGGGLGLNFGSGFTDLTIAPSAIYNFNRYAAAGVGLQGSYVRVKNNYESYIYGGSLIALVTPIEQIQVSAELEQLRVNTNFTGIALDDNFWNTALYLGVGYRTENVTIGVRYNLLYKAGSSVYSEPFMPFIRVYF